jgi:2-phosphoglycolate phosphatase
MKALLFDLDGTLIDSAPDFVSILNRLRAEEQKDPVDEVAVRAVLSEGSPKMIEVAFGYTIGSSEHQAVLSRLVSLYFEEMGKEGKLFSGVRELIDTIVHQKIPFGIVSNRKEISVQKAARIFDLKTDVLVGMDTVGKGKPDPAPLLHAASLLKIDPSEFLYVGDHLIDLTAARNAGMQSALVSWGYKAPDMQSWEPDHRINKPEDVLKL